MESVENSIRVEKSITINAPVHQAFEFVNNPVNLLQVWRCLLAIEDVQRLPSGAKRFRWKYKMVGVRFEGSAETVAYGYERRLVIHLRGGVDSMMEWRFQPHDDKTSVTLRMEFVLPAPLHRKHDPHDIAAEAERDVEDIVTNLKAILEAKPAGQ